MSPCSSHYWTCLPSVSCDYFICHYCALSSSLCHVLHLSYSHIVAALSADPLSVDLCFPWCCVSAWSIHPWLLHFTNLMLSGILLVSAGGKACTKGVARSANQVQVTGEQGCMREPQCRAPVPIGGRSSNFCVPHAHTAGLAFVVWPNPAYENATYRPWLLTSGKCVCVSYCSVHGLWYLSFLEISEAPIDVVDLQDLSSKKERANTSQQWTTNGDEACRDNWGCWYTSKRFRGLCMRINLLGVSPSHVPAWSGNGCFRKKLITPGNQSG